MPVQFTKYWDLKNYAFGGNAIISIVSNKTQTHFTYRFTSCEKVGDFNVEVLVGGKFRIFGRIEWYGKKFIYIPTYIPRTWKRYTAFLWVWRHVINKVFPRGVYIYREDRCCVCGKRLTNPKSILAGMGPECVKDYKGKLSA